MRVGIVALQGDVSEHLESFQKALRDLARPGEAVPIRRREEVAGCGAIAIPGGESTTISRLMKSRGITEEIQAAHRRGTPILGTCAGLILLARTITDELGRPKKQGMTSEVYPLGLMDIEVDRNAFGRQRESFEAPLQIHGLPGEPFPAVFIRAPAIQRTGPGVAVLGRHENRIVAARQGNLLGLAFHPELTGDHRLHRYFLEMTRSAAKR
ncbi:MAG: pyridoxal 5'-phosphate synthase glutaminase subunit PdxT [Euryarchaeota archaeon]|nr:pyridoxal 5'-phosphate synthase glutaminase subunit PdxT [Euryarchaeota archaeon]